MGKCLFREVKFLLNSSGVDITYQSCSTWREALFAIRHPCQKKPLAFGLCSPTLPVTTMSKTVLVVGHTNAYHLMLAGRGRSKMHPLKGESGLLKHPFASC